MKKLTLILFLFSLNFLMFACMRGENGMDLQNDYYPEDNNMEFTWAPELEEPPPIFEVPEGMSAEEFILQAWEIRVENILQSDVSRVEYVVRFRPWTEANIYITEDNLLIERWKTLLPQFRLSVVPAELLVGGSIITLNFYENDTPLQLLVGHSMPMLLFIPECRFEDRESWKRLRIDNFDEVGEEFLALLREMGVTMWEPVE